MDFIDFVLRFLMVLPDVMSANLFLRTQFRLESVYVPKRWMIKRWPPWEIDGAYTLYLKVTNMKLNAWFVFRSRRIDEPNINGRQGHLRRRQHQPLPPTPAVDPASAHRQPPDEVPRLLIFASILSCVFCLLRPAPRFSLIVFPFIFHLERPYCALTRRAFSLAFTS